MKRQAEYDEYAKLIQSAEKVVADLRNEQRKLGAFKYGDIVRFKGKVGAVASIDNTGQELKYTVAKLRPDGSPSYGDNLAWIVKEEELEVLEVVKAAIGK